MKRVRNVSAPPTQPWEGKALPPDHLSQLPHELWEHVIRMGELTARDRANWSQAAHTFREAIGRVHHIALHAMTEWRPHMFNNQLQGVDVQHVGRTVPMELVRTFDYNQWLRYQLCALRPLSELLPDWWTPACQKRGLPLNQWHNDPHVRIKREAEFDDSDYCSAVAGGYVTQILLNMMQASPPAGMTASAKAIDTSAWTQPDVDVFYGSTPTGRTAGDVDTWPNSTNATTQPRNPIFRWVEHVRRCAAADFHLGADPVKWRANQNVIDLDNGRVHVQFINIGADNCTIHMHPTGLFTGEYLGSSALEATVANFDMTCCQLAVSLESGVVMASPAAVAALLTGQVLVTPVLNRGASMETSIAAALYEGLALDTEVLSPDGSFFDGIGARRTRSYVRRLAKYQQRGFDLRIPLIPMCLDNVDPDVADTLCKNLTNSASLFVGGESSPTVCALMKPDARLRVQILRVSAKMAAAARAVDAQLAAIDPSNGMACYDFLHENDPMWELGTLPHVEFVRPSRWFQVGHMDDSCNLWRSIFASLAERYACEYFAEGALFPSGNTFLSGTIEHIREFEIESPSTRHRWRHCLHLDDLSVCIIHNRAVDHSDVAHAIAAARAAGALTA